MIKSLSLSVCAVAAALGATAPTAATQTLADRIEAVEDGKVRFSFASRPDVCGNGRGSISLGDRHSYIRYDRDDEWEWDCEHGPVRVVLRVRDGKVRDVDTHVGGRWRRSSATNLGIVGVEEAVEYLIALAERDRGEASEDAILPIVLADSVTVWPDLLSIARNESLRSDTRKSAVFWLGQAAGEAATAGLDSIATDPDGDREVRGHAIFALSQLPRDEGVPVLIRIARTHGDFELRKKALFWLGQTGDPRALDLFEELLTQQ